MDSPPLSRRNALKIAGLSAAAAALPWRSADAQTTTPATGPTTREIVDKRRFKIAGDDLFLLNRQKVKAFKVAQKARLDGIQLDMGSMPGGKEFKTTLNDPAVRQQFLDASAASGVSIASMAWFAMYARQFASLPMADELAASWVETMQQMNVKLGFMPLMVKAKDATAEQIAQTEQRTVDIFKKVAPLAEKAGVVLGVELSENADGYKKFLDAVGSPAVQAFYNPGVGLDNGFDVYADIRALGKDRVCALHLEQGSVTMMPGDKPETFERRLGDGLINFPKLRYVLMTMGWGGWMSIARSRLKGTTSPDTNMLANQEYLRKIFPE
jgi:sugar phosphate isomerase/epimerase